MTKEEQLDWLCRLRANLNNGVIFTPWNKEFTEALTDIIEQQTCDEYGNYKYPSDVELTEPNMVTSMSCEDCIGRQATLNALYALCDTGETLKENPWRDNPHIDALIDTIEQLPPVNPQSSGDLISRHAVLDAMRRNYRSGGRDIDGDHVEGNYSEQLYDDVISLLPVTPQKMGCCKDCKYFKYNYKVDDMPYKVAHEICLKWGHGCMTKEDGYCFLFESRAERVQNDT